MQQLEIVEDNSTHTIDDIVSKKYETLKFEGDTKEYFKIWIVNIFLTIVTFGVYSAWAKVRTNRYFYANTSYLGSSFEYTANPVSILKGRLFIVGIYAVFLFFVYVLSNIKIAVFILLSSIILIPWLINHAIKFKLKSIKYRNINFHYDENSFSFYVFFFIHLILNLIIGGLAYPYSLNRFKQLLINKSKFGDRYFTYHGRATGMYKQYFYIILLSFFYIILLSIVAGLLGALVGFSEIKIKFDSNKEFLSALSFLVIVLAISGIKGIYNAYITNYVWSNTTLMENSFESVLNPTMLAWIYISNMFAIVLSLGFLTPWAMIRLTRYRCAHFTIASYDIDNFIATRQKHQNSIGEEAGDFFDIDIGV